MAYSKPEPKIDLASSTLSLGAIGAIRYGFYYDYTLTLTTHIGDGLRVSHSVVVIVG